MSDGPVVDPVRVTDDDTTMGDIFAWHAADRPTCTQDKLTWLNGEFGPIGYRCPSCGWKLIA